jgi:hypothetical protein
MKSQLSVEWYYFLIIIGVSGKIDRDLLPGFPLFPRARATSILVMLPLDSSTRRF